MDLAMASAYLAMASAYLAMASAYLAMASAYLAMASALLSLKLAECASLLSALLCLLRHSSAGEFLGAVAHRGGPLVVAPAMQPSIFREHFSSNLQPQESSNKAGS